ncbi:MAG TPA: type IV pilus biogenesis/stability protein PilW [Sedimenticola sp.]|nr:type IV pilus biogenesis/stability protein PilW [Sedimenticola sp.]
MRGRALWLFLLLPLLAPLLSGCGGMATTGEEKTGKLAQDRTGAGDVYVKLAVAYMQRGQYDIALRQAQKAISVEPDNAQAHNVAALIFARLGENEVAERHFREALDLEPRNSYVRNAYGTFLCRQNRYQASEQEFMLALENPLYSSPEIAWTNAAICKRQAGDLKQAESYLRQGLQRNPRFPLALLEMTRLLLDEGRYRAAGEYLERYMAAARPTAESLWMGVRIARQLGDEEKLERYAVMLMKNFPDSEETQLLRESEAR